MREYKKIKVGLIFVVFLCFSLLVSGSLSLLSSPEKVYSQASSSRDQKATDYCRATFPVNQGDCENWFKAGWDVLEEQQAACSDETTLAGQCATAYAAGFNAAKSSGAVITTLPQSLLVSFCESISDVSNNTACADGVKGRLNGKNSTDSCKNYTRVDLNNCLAGWNGAQNVIDTLPPQCDSHANKFQYALACKLGVIGKQTFIKTIVESCLGLSNSGNPSLKTVCRNGYNNTDYPVTAEMKDECSDYAPGGSKANNSRLILCYAGYAKTVDCNTLAGTDNREACEVGASALVRATTDDSCEKRSGGFEFGWAVCPILRTMGDLAGVLDKQIQNQLEFDIDENLTPEVKQAWSIFRMLATALLVILMLVMIISQAVGGGPFEAYTIRKLLPRIVVAILLIQLSWELAKYGITLANEAGKGIQELLALPFGGPEELKLDKLVSNLGGAAGASSIALGLFSLTAVTIINPFGAALVVFMVFMAIVVGFGVLLVRTALIIACVIFMPIALVLWILGGTQRYYKMWADNFAKLLILFPLIAGMLIIGRIFAWIVGGGGQGGGTGGILDLFAVFIGCFGVYYLFPKALTSWGGSILSQAGRGIEKGVSPMKNLGKKEIQGLGERRQGKYASQYDPNANLRNRALRRLQSGSVLPTERSRRLTIAKGDKWKSERNDEASALVNRAYEIAMKEGGVGAAKQALVNIAGRDGKSDTDKRAAQAAVKQLIDTNSWIELQHSTVRGGANNGRRVFDSRASDGSSAWENTLTTSPQHYSSVIGKRPDLVPHMLQYTYTDTRMTDLGITAPADRDRLRGQRLSDADRMIMAINDQMGNEDFGKVAQGLYQEVNRLGDPLQGGSAADGQRVAQALRERLEQIERTGETGQRILGNMAGGSLRTDVNEALAREGLGARDIDSFIP